MAGAGGGKRIKRLQLGQHLTGYLDRLREADAAVYHAVPNGDQRVAFSMTMQEIRQEFNRTTVPEFGAIVPLPCLNLSVRGVDRAKGR